VFSVAATALYLFLLAAWATVAVRTARGAASGRLLLPPPPSPRPPEGTHVMTRAVSDDSKVFRG